jgi:hypothetical protein
LRPLGGALWDGGGETFIHKGTNGRWRRMLTAEDCRHYEDMAVRGWAKRVRAGWRAASADAGPVERRSKARIGRRASPPVGDVVGRQAGEHYCIGRSASLRPMR